MWNTAGKTVKRQNYDQTQTVTTWGGSQVPIPFSSLRNVGYLRRMFIYMPPTAGTITHGTGTNAKQSGAQFPQLKAINRFQLNLQGAASIYDVAGTDLAFLAYMRNGHSGDEQNAVNRDRLFGYSATAAISTANPPWVFPTNDNSLLGLTGLYGPALIQVSNTSVNFGYFMEIPISEMLVFPNTPIVQTQQFALLTEMPLEVGMIFMQNTQQNVTPFAMLAALYGLTQDSVVLVTGNDVAAMSSLQWTLETEYYDVPNDPADRPAPYQMSFIVTRTTQDVAVSGQAASVRYRAAGLLLKTAFVGYNDSDGTGGHGTLIDLTGTATTTMVMQSGNVIIKARENAIGNAYRLLDLYGTPPPGILGYDFVADGSIVEAIDTASLVDVRCDFTNLPSSCTRLHVIEERLIPVTVAS